MDYTPYESDEDYAAAVAALNLRDISRFGSEACALLNPASEALEGEGDAAYTVGWLVMRALEDFTAYFGREPDWRDVARAEQVLHLALRGDGSLAHFYELAELIKVDLGEHSR